MKKIYLIIISFLFLFGCGEDDSAICNSKPQPSIVPDSIASKIRQRTTDEIKRIATMVFPRTRTSQSSVIEDIIPIYNKCTRGNASPDLYAVNYADNGGFVLISSKRNIQPVLAIIDEGSYEDTANSENVNFQYLLENIVKYATYGNSVAKEAPHPSINAEYVDTIYPHPKQNPIVKVAWNQRWPEGMYCLNKIAGCAPVAAAQILSASRLPSSINYTYPNHELSSESLDWTRINTHKKSYGNQESCFYVDQCQLDSGTHHTIGRLVREIGHRANASYNEKSTTAGYYTIASIIENLTGKKSISEGDSPSSLYNALRYASGKNLVAYIYGEKKYENGKTEGHAWIADGIWEIGLLIRYWALAAVTDPNKPGVLVPYTMGSMSYYIHYNWGWGGNCNGYFLIDTLNPMEAYEFDNPYFNHSEIEDWSNKFLYKVYSTYR